MFATLQVNRPDDAAILIESTSNVEAFHRRVPMIRPHSFSLFASGRLDWALPGAVGYALAERDTGRHDNSGYGILKLDRVDASFRPVPPDLP